MKLKLFFIFLISAAFISACGVKSDPVAPESPDDIGHGKPLYKNPNLDDDGKPLKEKSDDEE